LKIIYIDCSAGLSGGALLGALVELGARPELLVEKIKSIAAIPFQLTFSKRQINGANATSTVLQVDAGQEPVPVAGMLKSVSNKVFIGGELEDRLNSLFDKFILAQSRVFHLPVAKVVMPEAELMRIIIIATGFFTALAQLGIERINASPLPVAFQLSAHNPAPLLMELAKGAVVKQYEGPGAPITPLGVALLTCQADEYGLLPEIRLSETGYGASSEGLQGAPRVRILCGTGRDDDTPPGQPETITVVETAIDDMNPEFFPFLIERLFAGGAADAFLTPIYMKKSRPAHLLTVLCNRSRLADVLSIIFQETTTLGVRVREDERRILHRYIFMTSTPYGEVAVKAGCPAEGGPPVQYAPEFEDCKKLALQHAVPIKEVYAAAQRAAHEYINKSKQNSR
jgi:uncharacterized protein (DUF111 family)